MVLKNSLWTKTGIIVFFAGAAIAIMGIISAFNPTLDFMMLIAAVIIALSWGLVSLLNLTDKERMFHLIATVMIIILLSAFANILQQAQDFNNEKASFLSREEIAAYNNDFISALTSTLQIFIFVIALSGFIVSLKTLWEWHIKNKKGLKEKKR